MASPHAVDTPRRPPAEQRSSEPIDLVERCVTCGRPAGSPYCPHCGEQRAADRSMTLAALTADAWDAFSPVDGRIGRTLWTLLRRPGQLTVEYLRGVRQPHVPPLRLFLLINVIYFLGASVVGQRTFDTPLSTHLSNTHHSSVARRFVAGRVAERGVTLEAYARRFNATSTVHAKSLVIVMVPMFALLVAAAEPRRGRGALAHVIFALHAIATMLLIVMLVPLVADPLIQLALRLTGARPDAGTLDLLSSTPIVLAFAAWVGAAVRRAYGNGRLRATLAALGLALGFGLVLFAYRAILFFTAFWAT